MVYYFSEKNYLKDVLKDYLHLQMACYDMQLEKIFNKKKKREKNQLGMMMTYQTTNGDLWMIQELA